MNYIDISEIRGPDLSERIRWYTDAAAWRAETRCWVEVFPSGSRGGDRWFITHNEDSGEYRRYTGLIWHVLPRPELRAAPPVMLSTSTALAFLEIDERWGEVFLERR